MTPPLVLAGIVSRDMAAVYWWNSWESCTSIACILEGSSHGRPEVVLSPVDELK